jgi:hypothetical protein
MCTIGSFRLKIYLWNLSYQFNGFLKDTAFILMQLLILKNNKSIAIASL